MVMYSSELLLGNPCEEGPLAMGIAEDGVMSCTLMIGIDHNEADAPKSRTIAFGL